MAFVNEYMSQEDIAKYEFEGLAKKYSNLYDSSSFLIKAHWTVDKERELVEIVS